MFSGGGSREGGRRGSSVSHKGSDIAINLELDFMEAVEGAQKTVTFSRTDTCKTCNGTKAKPGTSPSTCGGCGGQGFQTIRQGPFMIQQVCGNCDGKGQVNRSPCITCRGRGNTTNQVKETVEIPKGVDTGVNLKVSKKGNAGDGGPNGDLIIHVKVRSHPTFKREGHNVHTDLQLSIAQAILGDTVTVPTLSGETNLKIPAGTQHGTQMKIAN